MPLLCLADNADILRNEYGDDLFFSCDRYMFCPEKCYKKDLSVF